MIQNQRLDHPRKSPDGEQPLNRHLAGSVLIERDNEVADDHGQPVELGEAEAQVQEGEFVIGITHLHDLADPTRYTLRERKGDQDRPQSQNEELHHVGPDHGGQPTQGGVGGRHQSHDDDRAPKVETSHGRESESWGIEGDPHPSLNLQNLKERGGVASPTPETRAHVFVDAGHVEPSIDGKEEQNHQGSSQQRGRQPQHQSGVLPIRHRGRSQIGQGAQETGNHTQGHRHPGHVAIGQKVGRGTFLLAGEGRAKPTTTTK